MTALKLVDSWFSKGNKKLRLESVPVPKMERKVAERILALLLVEGFIEEEFHFTPYSTISYLTPGSKGHTHLARQDPSILFSIPLLDSKLEKTCKKRKQNNAEKRGQEQLVKKKRRKFCVEDDSKDISTITLS